MHTDPSPSLSPGLPRTQQDTDTFLSDGLPETNQKFLSRTLHTGLFCHLFGSYVLDTFVGQNIDDIFLRRLHSFFHIHLDLRLRGFIASFLPISPAHDSLIRGRVKPPVVWTLSWVYSGGLPGGR